MNAIKVYQVLQKSGFTDENAQTIVDELREETPRAVAGNDLASAMRQQTGILIVLTGILIVFITVIAVLLKH